MESNNISDYERALELKQRQINESERGVSLKLQQGWQKLKETSLAKDFYLKQSERSFKELRESPIIERQFKKSEYKISELNSKTGVQKQELAELRTEVRALKNQGSRVRDLLKVAKSIKGNRLENSLNEELLTLALNKNRAVLGSKNEIEIKEKDDLIKVKEAEAFIDSTSINPVVSDSSGNVKINLNPDNFIATDRFACSSSCNGKTERKAKHSESTPEEQEKKDCQVEFRSSAGENININLVHSPEIGLQAEVLTDSAQRRCQFSAEKINIIRKLKKSGYAEVLLNFGIS